jgi:hypothetical protein
MATKITKSELKQIIREALREEFTQNKPLKEAYSIEEIAEILKANGLTGVSQRDLAQALRQAKGGTKASAEKESTRHTTVADLKKMAMPSGKYVLSYDADDEYSYFYFWNGKWEGGKAAHSFGGGSDMDNVRYCKGSILPTFADAVDAAVIVHKKYPADYLYVGTVDSADEFTPIICIDRAYSGVSRVKFYDTANRWHDEKELIFK